MTEIKKYVLENISWIIGAFATILAAILSIIFLKNNKKKNSQTAKIKISKSDHSEINVISNQRNKNLTFQNEISQRDKSLNEMFRLLNITIRSISIGLRPNKVNPPKTSKEYLDEAIDTYNAFVNYSEETELFYTQDEISLNKEMNDLFLKCLKQQELIETYKVLGMPQEKLFKECDIMIEYYENDIAIKIPELREKIKTLITSNK